MTTEMSCLPVPETEVQDQGVGRPGVPLKALGETLLASCSFWWLPEMLGIPWLVAAPFQALPPSHLAFSRVSSVSLCLGLPLLCLTNAPAIGLTVPHPVQYDSTLI